MSGVLADVFATAAHVSGDATTAPSSTRRPSCLQSAIGKLHNAIIATYVGNHD